MHKYDAVAHVGIDARISILVRGPALCDARYMLATGPAIIPIVHQHGATIAQTTVHHIAQHKQRSPTSCAAIQAPSAKHKDHCAWLDAYQPTVSAMLELKPTSVAA